jgi:hypothetical protein
MTMTRALFLVLLSLHSVPSVEALASPTPPSSRRSFVASSIGAGLGILGVPSMANAVKERNEALCGTGFFTNIWQYKCTDIGDIADEGVPKDLSSSEQGATESLMSKFNLGDAVVDLAEGPSATKEQANESSKKK